MVSRQPIDVRRVGAGDEEDLLRLWLLAREDVGPLGRPLGTTSPEALRPRLRAALAGDDVQIVLARWDGRPAGYSLVRVVPVAALLDGSAVQIEHLYVVPELRRHGVARALLAAVTGIAERAGAEQIVSSAPPGARDSHRFLARLGFSPVVVRRVVATSVLRRKLAGEARRGGLEDLLSRRRSLRARAGWPRRGETAAEPEAPAAEVAAGELTAAELVSDELVGEELPPGDPKAAEPGSGRTLTVALGHDAVSGSGTSVPVGGAP